MSRGSAAYPWALHSSLRCLTIHWNAIGNAAPVAEAAASRVAANLAEVPLAVGAAAGAKAALPADKGVLDPSRSDQPVQRGQPVTVEVKLSRSVLSELRRPTGLTHDPKYDKKAALLVAIDTERLRALGQGHGLRPLQAARRRLLAQEALCAPRARLHEGQSQTQLQLQLEPRELPGRESVVLLQVVVEAVIDKVHWIHFGRLVPVRIAAPVEGEAQEALA
eukprot:CAMPEP_0204596972 /NCGR_PEP_ID=MMETSP0661-20131031/53544_1 /ASSEMBLY_ACC=CAM_ASM_000606 /TAXON_ID=109239 /ORGANISM="Alexandrium margalefi, Strain AMGDE01CS-322" /LENGTH=220 /DNA_ID=CAMNT_0051607639 /DNA_START=12 /DNA_END=675 /DNA_ORIENTATION=+